MINSVLLQPGACFACFNIKNFYIDTSLEDQEYVRIKLTDIPQGFIDEYNLTKHVRHGWIYFDIIRSAYGLKQFGKLSNDLLRTRLEEDDYYETYTTPDLWQHTWRPIQFVLVVDDFGVEYVGEEHTLHLVSILKRYHEISQDWEGKKYTGIDLEWNYAKVHKDRMCRLLVKGYIAELLLRLGPDKPSKPQLSPHKSKDITYGSNIQLSPDVDTSSELKKDEITRVQIIMGALLWIG